MRLRTKTALWFRLGGHQKQILTTMGLVEKITNRLNEAVDILTKTNTALNESNTFIGDVASLLVDLMADVSDLAARSKQKDIVDRIDARAEIAGQMFAISNIRRREEEHGH